MARKVTAGLLISRLFFSPRLWELGASWSRHEGSWHSSQLCPSLPLTVSVGVLFSFLPQCSFFSVSPPFLLHVFISSFLDFFLPFICYIVLSSCLAIVLSFVFLPLFISSPYLHLSPFFLALPQNCTLSPRVWPSLTF